MDEAAIKEALERIEHYCLIDAFKKGASEGVAKVPEWLPVIAPGVLTPMGYQVTVRDGRPAFYIRDPKALVASWNALEDRFRVVPVDINHGTLLGWHREDGEAYGKIVEFEARDDGSIWGKFVANADGGEKVAKYLFTSPVVVFNREEVNGELFRYVVRVESLALTNNPATYSHLVEGFNRRFGTDGERDELEVAQVALTKISKELGLPETATEAEVFAALAQRKNVQAFAQPGVAVDSLATERAALEAQRHEVEREKLAIEQAKLANEKAALARQSIELELAGKTHITPAQREALSKMGVSHGVEAMRAALEMLPAVDMSAEIKAPGAADKKSELTDREKSFCRYAQIDEKDYMAERARMFGGE